MSSSATVGSEAVADRGRRELAPRPSRGLGSWWAIGLGAVGTAAGLALTGATAPCSQFHLAVELAGSDQRLSTWIPGCTPDLGAGRVSLAWDFLLIAGYVLLLASVLRRWWPLYHAPRLKAATRGVIALPVAAGAFDVVENGLIAIGLRVRNGRFAYPDRLALPISVATVSWLKWTLLVCAALAAVAALLLAFARRGEPERPQVRRAAAPVDGRDPGDDLGVCCSGGGIRAAAFALGALDRLETEGVMSEARWLSAVSGGAYAATAWRLAKASDPEARAAADVIDWLREPVPGSPAGRHRFLRNGPGGLGRPAFAALAYVFFNLVVLGAFVYALAWPIGWLLGSDAVQPAMRRFDTLPARLDVRAELWLPGVLLLLLAGVVLGISSLPSWKLANLWRAAVALVAAGLVLEVLLVAMPLSMVSVGGWLTGGTNGVRASTVGTSALLGAVATVFRIVRKPVMGRITSRLPQLGGVLLAVVVIVWGGKVATDAAVGAGTFRDPRLWLVVTLAFVAVYLFVGVTNFSIHRIYRKRLRRTFGLSRDAKGALFAPAQDAQRTWDEMPADDPELVICCAQQRTGIASGGLPAESFTISRREVRIGDVVVPTASYLARLNGGLAVERCVASWIATSGAAFASAMGRLSKGSTNALMAALNVDLGIWLPNPRLVEDPNARFPKVRLGYLFKEILGWYDPADRFVFVADGGHWENLGLVELLRKRCRTIICIDASGDRVGAFTTLRQAVELASLELPDTVADIDLTGLESITPPAGALPAGVVATLAVTYRGPDDSTSEGTILYAKAQLASNVDIALRRFAKADRLFPNYSTGNQFLSDAQFTQLVALGRGAGDRLLELMDPTPRTRGSADQAIPSTSP